MKVCKKCKLSKPFEAFNFKNKNNGIRQAWCKDCTRMAIRKHYFLNRQYYLEKAQLRNRFVRQTTRRYILNYLKAHPCIDCGEKDSVVLTFDHVYAKKANISDMTHWRYSLEDVKKEIEKCVVRCANCHLRKTAKQFNWNK